MSKGYVKIYRDLQDCWVWFDDEKFTKGQAWVDLLMLANHKDKRMSFKDDIVTIKRGEYFTSITALSERWNWSFNTTKRFLNLLEKDNMLTRKSDNKKTLITIVNYGFYQGGDDEEATTIDSLADSQTDRLIDSQTDSLVDRQADSLGANKLTPNKNDKNDKNIIINNISNNKRIINNNIYNVHFGTLWDEYIRKDGKSKAYRMYQARLNEGYSEEELLQAVKSYMQECKDNHTEKKYIKLCSTFLGIDKPFTDYLDKGGVADGNKELEVGSREWMERHEEQLNEIRKHMPDL